MRGHDDDGEGVNADALSSCVAAVAVAMVRGSDAYELSSCVATVAMVRGSDASVISIFVSPSPSDEWPLLSDDSRPPGVGTLYKCKKKSNKEIHS